MNKVTALLGSLKKRSNNAFLLATAAVFAYAPPVFANANPAETVRNVVCNIYNNVLSNRGLVFGVVLMIIAWAGYMVYMGKREATDVIIKALIATAIILGATSLAGWVVSGTGAACP